MTFWGFGMNFMLRMNLNIAIVSMVRPTVKDGLKSEYIENRNALQNTSYLIDTNIDNVSIIFINVYLGNIIVRYIIVLNFDIV